MMCTQAQVNTREYTTTTTIAIHRQRRRPRPRQKKTPLKELMIIFTWYTWIETDE